MEMIMEKLIEAAEKIQKFDTRTSRIPKMLRFQYDKRVNICKQHKPMGRNFLSAKPIIEVPVQVVFI
ncbi:hypothetical protein T06_10479 [Trichinella sp. T6]|nr:hypothetical protein T06_10479 [Trichinella sp. T6]